MLKKTDLRPAQRAAADKILAMYHGDDDDILGPAAKGVILALDLGSGKTASTLTAIQELHEEKKLKRVLVIAPLLVATVTWPDEIMNWDHTRDLPYTLIRATDDHPDVKASKTAARLQAKALLLDDQAAADHIAKVAAEAKHRIKADLAETKSLIHIINREEITWLWGYFGKKWPYDMMVIDDVRETGSAKEITKLGNITRYKALMLARQYTNTVVQLTGTPCSNGAQQLWGRLFLADDGRRLGTTRHQFKKRFFKKGRTPFSKQELNDDSMDKILRSIRDMTFSLAPKDLPSLPGFEIIERKVTLDKEELAKYRKFKREMVIELKKRPPAEESEEEEGDSSFVEAVNGAVLNNKLLQFANGSMYDEEGDGLWIHDKKLAELKKIVAETTGTPLLVAYTYKFDVERIRREFPHAVVLNEESDAREVVERWNRKEIPLLLAHRASAGHGLNLQFGSNLMVEYGLTYDLELYLQFLKRILRPGQTKTVFNYVISATGTIDDDIMPTYLSPKMDVQNQLLAGVQMQLS